MKEFKPRKPEKPSTTVRIEVETLKVIDNLAKKIDISRNELIVQCINFALDSLVLEDETDEDSCL